jgi:hypothetical protein
MRFARMLCTSEDEQLIVVTVLKAAMRRWKRKEMAAKQDGQEK